MSNSSISPAAIGTLLAKLPIEERLTPGQEQEFSIPREKLHVFDAQTELAVSA